MKHHIDPKIEKERNYHAYQARQNYLRQQRTIQWEIEEERKAKLQAMLEKEAALQEKEAALAEIERLKALLADKEA